MDRNSVSLLLVSLAILTPSLGLTGSGSPIAAHSPWESWDRETMGRAYNAAAAVPESAAMFKVWVERSKAFRAAHSEHLDVVYGPRERNRIDYYSAGPGTPVLAFLHGGWWQLRAKEDFAFLAESFVAEGISVAMVGYPLAPDATMDEFVADTHTAIRYLAGELPRLGGDPRHFVVSGWSAGGHLTTMVLEEPAVHAGVSISGLFDLRPLLNSYINDKLKMDNTVAVRNSPQFHLPARSKRLELYVGANELPEMIRQSQEFAAARKAAGLPAHFRALPGANHYTMLDDLASPDGELHRTVLSALR